jgi:hypothetical protein
MRFTLRELILCLTVVALMLGWVIDHSSAARAQQKNAVWKVRAEFLVMFFHERGWKIQFGPDSSTSHTIVISPPAPERFGTTNDSDRADAIGEGS